MGWGRRSGPSSGGVARQTVGSPPDPVPDSSVVPRQLEAVMRRIGIGCCAVVLLACGQTKDKSATEQAAQPPMDSATMAPTPAAPAAISLADAKGKWKMRTMAEG